MHSPVACKLQGSVFAMAYEDQKAVTSHSSVKTTSLNTLTWGRGIKKDHNGSQGVKGSFLLLDL
jgi:hypothetical protein